MILSKEVWKSKNTFQEVLDVNYSVDIKELAGIIKDDEEFAAYWQQSFSAVHSKSIGLSLENRSEVFLS